MSRYRATMRPRSVNLAALRARFNEAPAVEEAPAPEIVETITPEPTPAPEPVAAVEDNLSDLFDIELDPPAPATPKWEPTWTKAQLLTVAAGLGLSVDGTNTKAEIVAALTAAAPQ